MKKLLKIFALSLTLPLTASAIEVGDCINLDRVKPQDPGYLYKVDSLLNGAYLATHTFTGKQKVLPAKFRFVKVDCPTQEDVTKYQLAVVEMQRKIQADLADQARRRQEAAEQQLNQAKKDVELLQKQKDVFEAVLQKNAQKK